MARNFSRGVGEVINTHRGFGDKVAGSRFRLGFVLCLDLGGSCPGLSC